MYMYMSSGTTSTLQSRRTSSRRPSGKIDRKAADRSRPGNTSRRACFPAFTFRFTGTTAMSQFPSSPSKKNLSVGSAKGGSKTASGHLPLRVPRARPHSKSRCFRPSDARPPSLLMTREPAGEVLPVPLSPCRVHTDLLNRLLDGASDLRGLAVPEESFHIFRPVRCREALRDVNESANEEPGLRVPPVQFVPIVLHEGPSEVEPDAGADRSDICDHDDRVLGSDRVRQRAAERLLEESLVPRLGEGDEEPDLLLLKRGLALEVPQRLVRGLVRLLGDERVDEPAQVRVEGRRVLQVAGEALRGFVERAAVLVVPEGVQDRC